MSNVNNQGGQQGQGGGKNAPDQQGRQGQGQDQQGQQGQGQRDQGADRDQGKQGQK